MKNHKTTDAIKNQRKALLGIIVLSIILKGLFILQDPVVNPDALVYISAAHKYSEGLFAEGIKYYSMPLYPLMLATAHSVLSDWILAGQLLSAVPLILSILPLYILTSQLFDRKSGLAASLLFTVLPVFNETSTEIMRDPLFLFFTLSALALLAQNHYKYASFSLIGSVLFAVIATLIRIEGILLLIVVPSLLFWQSRHQLNANSAIKIIAIILLSIFSLALFLWGFSFWGTSSQSRLPEVFDWVKKIVSFEIFDNYHFLMERLRDIEHQLPGNGYKNNLIENVRHYAPFLYIIGLIQIMIKEVWPISIVALWALRYRKKRLLSSSSVMLLCTILLFMLLNLVFCIAENFTTTRYMWIPIVLLIPFIGNGITLLWDRLFNQKIVLALLFVMFFVAPAGKTLAQINSDRPSVRQAAQWLKQKDPNQQMKVVFNDRRLALYSDRIYAPISFDAINRIKANQYWMAEADIFILSLKDNDFDHIPLKGFRELARFKDKKTDILILERGSSPK